MGRGLGVLLITLVVASVAAAAPTAQVAVTDTSLSPALVAIDSGGSVTWRNTGARSHRLASGDNSFAAFTLAPGAERTVQFTSNGRHPYTVDGGRRCGVVFVGVPMGAGCTAGAGTGRVSGGRVRPPRTGTRTYTYDVQLRFQVMNHGINFYDGRREQEWTRTHVWTARFRTLKFKVITVGRLAIGVHLPSPRPATATAQVAETWKYFWHPHALFPPDADCEGSRSGRARLDFIAALNTTGRPNYYVKAQLGDGWNSTDQIKAVCNGWTPPGSRTTEFRLSDGTNVDSEMVTLELDFERAGGGLRAPAGQLASGGGFTIDTGLRVSEQSLCPDGGLCAGSTLTIEERYVAIFRPRR